MMGNFGQCIKCKRLNWLAKSSVSDPVFVKIRKQNQDKLKKCPECECVWEPHYQTKTIRRYFDFPAFGLKKEICNNCKTSDWF